MKETYESGLVRIRPSYQSIISELLERADELHKDAQEYGLNISMTGYSSKEDKYSVSVSGRNKLTAFYINGETRYTYRPCGESGESQSIAYEDISFEILR